MPVYDEIAVVTPKNVGITPAAQNSRHSAYLSKISG
jgi:hypothetical protein